MKRKPKDVNIDLKNIENEWLVCGRVGIGRIPGMAHQKRKSFVVCAGLIYGLGEECTTSFNNLLMSAWNNDEKTPLIQIGNGSNVLPTIHVKDLAKMIHKLIDSNIDSQENCYLFAIDKAGFTQTQQQIIESISKKLEIIHIQKLQSFTELSSENKEIFNTMTINLKINFPSLKLPKLLKDEEWYCKNGFSQNVEKIFDEFKFSKGLRSIRLVLIGPPLSGKTYFSNLYFFVL